MKKILIALMVLLLALTVVACGGPTNEDHVHAYSEETVPSTCLEAGKVITKCSCGDVQSETALPLADHTASAVDCEKDTVCTVCGVVLSEKTGHTIVSAEVVTEATCSVPGKERGACTTCGKIAEIEIPVSAHKANENSVWTLVEGGYSTTCASCNQAIIFKEDAPVLSLTFEEAYEDEIAKYPLFKKVGTFAIVDDIDGDKAGSVSNAWGPNSNVWLDVVDNAVMRGLGSYAISFDLMMTKEADAGKEPSVFSLLTNYADGSPNVGGTTGWGFAFKFNEDADKLSTIGVGTDFSKHTNENSLAVEKNKNYTVQLVYVDGTDRFEVFVDGKYLGKSGGAIGAFQDGVQISFRFGDSPNPGFVFDNIKICGIK